jgi:hypothetical protein
MANATDELATYPLTENGSVASDQGRINTSRRISSTGYFTNSSMVFGNNNWTVALWFYITSSQMNNVLTLLSKTGDFVVSLNGSDPNRYLQMDVSTSGGTFGHGYFNANQNIISNAWNLCVAQIITSTTRLSISTNGNSPLQFDYSSQGTKVGSANDFTIGATVSAASAPGIPIDEGAYWTRAISSSEITQIWNSGNGLAYSSYDAGLLSGLGAYWKMDEIPPPRIVTPLRAGMPLRFNRGIAKVYR